MTPFSDWRIWKAKEKSEKSREETHMSIRIYTPLNRSGDPVQSHRLDYGFI